MTIIRMKDGRIENIGRDRDFTELIRREMGDDCAEFYENRIQSLVDQVDETVDEMEAVFDEIMTAKGEEQLRQMLMDYKTELISTLKDWEITE